MITISVSNQKGGVGKTTTAVNVAHGLSLKNHTVLLVDADPQGQCSTHLGMQQESGVFNWLCGDPRPPLRDVVRTTRRPGLYLLPGNKRTATAQTILAVEGFNRTLLAQLLGELQLNSSRLHYVVIDSAPSVGGIQEMALYAADLVLIPAAVDFLALEGVAQILTTLQALGRSAPPQLRVLPTFFDDVTKESRANLAQLRERFGGVVLDPVHRASILRECPAQGVTIFEHPVGKDSRAAQEYANVVWGVIRDG